MPDFDGWEVKAGLVDNYAKLATSKAVTLMTPEPDGGYYQIAGVEAFIRRFGYEDRMGREDRFNFGGIFRVGARHPLTGLTMQLSGFDSASGNIVDTDGVLQLIDDDEVVAASWTFAINDNEKTKVTFLYSFKLRFPYSVFSTLITFILKRNVKQRLKDLKIKFAESYNT